MIIADIEGTGLFTTGVAALDAQPRIVEFAAVKLDDNTLEERDRIQFLCNPGVPLLPERMMEITSITNEMIKDAPKFVRFYPKLVDFFLGERRLITHNISYDARVLHCELQRLERVTQFPWPPDHFCTIEQTRHLTGKNLSLQELYKLATGQELAQTHRAMDDVQALVACVTWGKEQGWLV